MTSTEAAEHVRPTKTETGTSADEMESQGASADKQRQLNIATTLSGDAELRAEGARRLRQRRGQKRHDWVRRFPKGGQ
jgi:hypothetical protein